VAIWLARQSRVTSCVAHRANPALNGFRWRLTQEERPFSQHPRAVFVGDEFQGPAALRAALHPCLLAFLVSPGVQITGLRQLACQNAAPCRFAQELETSGGVKLVFARGSRIFVWATPPGHLFHGLDLYATGLSFKLVDDLLEGLYRLFVDNVA
jgi:hypothetical protein